MTAMIPAQKNFILPIGTDWERWLAFKTRAADGTMTPIDLTGYTFRMQIRNKRGFGAVLIADVGASGTIESTDPTTGQVRLFLPASYTGTIDLTTFGPAQLPTRTIAEITDAFGRQRRATGPTGVYDFELIAPSGDVQRPIQGDICMVQEAAR